MKPTLVIIILLSFGSASSHLFSQSTRLEAMNVKTYAIDLVVESANGEGNYPHPWHIIKLEGTPGNGSKMKKMVLNFYAENDGRCKFKPSYDEGLNMATAHFPVSEFDKFYEILKHKKNGLSALYVDTPSLSMKEVKLRVGGSVPMGI